MIFTGVTGGEIVSLLYPLFILSPFCYIIISKESLDGSAYLDSRLQRLSIFTISTQILSLFSCSQYILHPLLFLYERFWDSCAKSDCHVSVHDGGTDFRTDL